MNLSYFAISNIKGSDYYCIISGISKIDAINLMQNTDLTKKYGTIWKNYDGQTKWMYFLIEDDDLLEKYNTIWNKASAEIKVCKYIKKK